MSLASFHDQELFVYADAALAAGFFEAWLSTANAARLPLQWDQYVGYKVSLFLGGPDVVENLERGDLAVYWLVCGQLHRGALRLPPGTSINEVFGP